MLLHFSWILRVHTSCSFTRVILHVRLLKIPHNPRWPFTRAHHAPWFSHSRLPLSFRACGNLSHFYCLVMYPFPYTTLPALNVRRDPEATDLRVGRSRSNASLSTFRAPRDKYLPVPRSCTSLRLAMSAPRFPPDKRHGLFEITLHNLRIHVPLY